MIGGAEASFIGVSLASCVDGEQQQQARGKGRAPEAGPRHGAAGLRVKPERAAAIQRNAACASMYWLVCCARHCAGADRMLVRSSRGARRLALALASRPRCRPSPIGRCRRVNEGSGVKIR